MSFAVTHMARRYGIDEFIAAHFQFLILRVYGDKGYNSRTVKITSGFYEPLPCICILGQPYLRDSVVRA